MSRLVVLIKNLQPSTVFHTINKLAERLYGYYSRVMASDTASIHIFLFHFKEDAQAFAEECQALDTCTVISELHEVSLVNDDWQEGLGNYVRPFLS